MPGGVNIFIGGEGSSAQLELLTQAAFHQLAEDLEWYWEQVREGLPEDMIKALEPTLEKSKELCPKETGRLVDSAYLEVTSNDHFNPGVEIGYAKNGDPDYALYVHELPATHEPPTRDKFLQIPIEEDYFDIPGRVAAIMKARLGI